MLLYLVVERAAAILKKYPLDANSQARCLDGTVPNYYLDVLDPSKLLIYLEGGSLCIGPDLNSTITACNLRSQTYLGSSKGDGQILKPGYDSQILFSLNETVNPLFYNYSKVYIRYCDGSLYQGFRSQPIKVNGTSLHFRGSSNTIGVIQALRRKGLGSSSVALAGTSAGGVGSSLWADYVSSQLNSAQFFAIIDSGIFPFFEGKRGNPFLGISLFIGGFLNKERPELFPQNCTDDCFDPSAVLSRIKAQHLILQPIYDQYNLVNSAGISCAAGRSLSKCDNQDRALAESFASTMRSTLAGIQNNKSSYFAIGCVIHGLLQVQNDVNYQVPNQSGVRVREAMLQWRQRGRLLDIDSSSWPGNAQCANLKDDQK